MAATAASSAVSSVVENKYVFENGTLKLNGTPVQVYYFSDAPNVPWFQAKPIHNFLGAKNMVHTMNRVYDDNKSSLKELVEQKGSPVIGVGTSDVPTLTVEKIGYHAGKALYVNEPGLYQIIFGSDKLEAKAFTRWVTEVVLPTLRRTGTFSTTPSSSTSTTTTTSTTAVDIVELRTELVAFRNSFKSEMLAILNSEREAIHHHMLSTFSHRLANGFKDLTELMNIERTSLVNNLCFALSQRLKDVKDGIVAHITNPTDLFVDALRRAVKKPALKRTTDSERFPDDQRVTPEEERYAVSLSVILSEVLTEIEKSSFFPGAPSPTTKLTYGAWKKCRALIGSRCIALRKKESNITKPKAWTNTSDGGRSCGGGQYYVYLSESKYSVTGNARNLVKKVLKQKKTKRSSSMTVEEHIRGLIRSSRPDEQWPTSTSMIDAFPLNEKEETLGADMDII